MSIATPEGKGGNSRAALRRKRKSMSKPEIISEQGENIASARKKQHSMMSTNSFNHLDIGGILKLEEMVEIESSSRYEALMEHILSPLSLSSFHSQFWQKSVYHSARGKPTHFKGLLTKKKFDGILQDNVNITGTNVAVAGVADGKELTLKEIEKHISRGRAVSILNPHVHNDNLWRFLFALEVGLELIVDAHAVFIPASNAGFGEHVNTTDSFILQLEGSSKWTVTDPKAPEESAVMEFTLQVGDSVYIPKGWKSLDHAEMDDSLYLKVITNNTENSTSMGQLVEMVLTRALDETTPTMDMPLPPRCLSYMGVARSENDDDLDRTRFTTKFKSLLSTVVDAALEMVDAGVDQIATSFLANRLPVPLSATEERSTYSGNTTAAILPFTKLRMVRPGVARVMIEDGMVVVYHIMDNARDRNSTLQPLEFELDDGPAIEQLLDAYPAAVTVQDLPHSSEELEDKIAVAQALYKEGFLVIEDEVSRNDAEADDDDPF